MNDQAVDIPSQDDPAMLRSLDEGGLVAVLLRKVDFSMAQPQRFDFRQGGFDREMRYPRLAPPAPPPD